MEKKAQKLTAAGVNSPEKLIESGSRRAFLQLKEAYPQVCLVHLYALEGAIRHTAWNRLSDEPRKDLKAFNGLLKSSAAQA
ncbi:TfoX/Sxy family DNA transformation protein [uncultured Dysosmobacter sp.]|uniref:TfoX/Sxy family DNA transformation protein n=1 Tax=uncultured Dysosmobacter sp. TaxID=2591384 RepID=UPI002603A203|nr:TfoX/Sxy family DNA transformation protein [uncultured Dysosmobacter sp.]